MPIRPFLTATAVAALSACLAPPAQAAESLLFAHDAASGTIRAASGASKDYVVTLRGVRPAAVFFDDRPGNASGDALLKTVLDGFFEKPGVARPNAAIDAVGRDGKQYLMTVKLLSRRYDTARHRLRYRVRLLDRIHDRLPAGVTARTNTLLPRHFHHVSVFIDTLSATCAAVLYTNEDTTLALVSHTLVNEHDSWYRTPPASLSGDVSGKGYWLSEAGLFRGCANRVVWGDAHGTVTVYVESPYTGGNTFSCTTTGDYVCQGPVDSDVEVSELAGEDPRVMYRVFRKGAPPGPYTAFGAGEILRCAPGYPTCMG